MIASSTTYFSVLVLQTHWNGFKIKHFCFVYDLFSWERIIVEKCKTNLLFVNIWNPSLSYCLCIICCFFATECQLIQSHYVQRVYKIRIIILYNLVAFWVIFRILCCLVILKSLNEGISDFRRCKNILVKIDLSIIFEAFMFLFRLFSVCAWSEHRVWMNSTESNESHINETAWMFTITANILNYRWISF